MRQFGRMAAYNAPDHILFPEAYAAAKRQIVKDYLFFGTYIVWGVVLVAAMGTASAP